MAQIDIIRMDSSKAGIFELDDALAEAPFNPFLVKDAVVYQQAKLRQGTHATKTRSMVAGSSRKLYRQKSTGSARVGNKKAVQRRGGGVVHGPHPRSHAFSLNKKVRKAALRCALAEKLRRGQLLVMETLEPETHKTQAFAAWLKGMEADNALLITDDIGPNLALAARNLPKVDVVHYGQLNVYNLLLFKKALVTRVAMEKLAERLSA